MAQNSSTGNDANQFGHKIARFVASKLGLVLTGRSTSNQCDGPKGLGIIKSARTSNYIGILKSMLPQLNVIYAVIMVGKDLYQVFEIGRIEFEKLKFDPSAEKNKNQWFIKVSDIKSLRPILKVVFPDHPPGSTESNLSQPVPSRTLNCGADYIDDRIHQLFATYNKVIDELKDLKVIRSTNNPAGDYGEFIAQKELNLIQAPKSAKGFDLTDDRGKKYQVKTRRVTEQNPSRLLGGFRDLDEKLFDYCLAIILSDDFKLREMWEIPHDIICKYARNTTRGFKRVVLNGSILTEPTVKRLL